MADDEQTTAPAESLLTQSLMGIYTAGKLPYLGDPKVVLSILVDMVDVVRESPEFEAIHGAIEDATAALTGGAPEDYAPMGKWNTGDGIGNWIRGHLKGVPDGDSADAVRYALAHLVLHYMDTLKSIAVERETPDEAGARFQQIIFSWVCLFVGLPYVTKAMPTEAGAAAKEAQ
jgi:hypothetical protein